jgi:ABC-type transport system involved in multi-copper enzyme maturation permease subunit
MTAVLPDPGFGATLRSEWTKFSSLRSARLTLLLGTVFGIGAAALLGWAVLATWDEWTPEDRAAFVPAEDALIGTIITGTLFAVLGVTVVSSEYSSRMAALTFTATPRRWRVLLAKVLVVAVATTVATAIAALGMILVGLAMFAGLHQTTPGAGRLVRIVLAVAANSTLLPVLGVALTFVLRSAAGSVAALLMLTFGPLALGPLLPQWWGDHGQFYLPGAAMDALTLPGFTDVAGQLDRGPAALVVAGWLVLFLGAAAVVLDRRDV